MNYSKLPGLRNRTAMVLSLIIGCSLVLTLIGCDAFVRKFTRKPKKENLPREEMVLTPREYKNTMTKEEQYRQYFMFWKSWQDEIIESLATGTNHKKQVGCIDEAIKNLQQLRTLLNSPRQQKLDAYIERMNSLRESVDRDAYGSDRVNNRATADSIKRGLLRDFSYPKIKDGLA